MTAANGWDVVFASSLDIAFAYAAAFLIMLARREACSRSGSSGVSLTRPLIQVAMGALGPGPVLLFAAAAGWRFCRGFRCGML